MDLLPAERPVVLKGIKGGDGGMHIKTEGCAKFLRSKRYKAFYHPNASVNVLGWSALRNSGVRLEHNPDEDYFIVDHVLLF